MRASISSPAITFIEIHSSPHNAGRLTKNEDKNILLENFSPPLKSSPIFDLPIQVSHYII